VILAGIILLTYIAISADAISDSAVRRWDGVAWLEWHMVKWIRLYVPMAIIAFLCYYAGLITLSKLNVLGLIAYVCLGWILWEVMYKAKVLG